MSSYLFNLALGVDQLLNVLIAGSPDETLSARAHRMRVKKQRYWGWTADCLDWLFKTFFNDHNHCYNSWLSERESRQLPPGYHD